MIPSLPPILARNHISKGKSASKSPMSSSQRFFHHELSVEPDNLLLNLDRMYRKLRKSLEGSMKPHAETLDVKASPRQKPSMHYFRRKETKKSPRNDPLLRTVAGDKHEVWVFKKTHRTTRALGDTELQKKLAELEKHFL